MVQKKHQNPEGGLNEAGANTLSEKKAAIFSRR
jgi:hypothetical protein